MLKVSLLPSDFDLPCTGEVARASCRGISTGVSFEKCGTKLLLIRTGSLIIKGSRFPNERLLGDPIGLRDTTDVAW